MNLITEITKRDILDLFKNGLEIDDFEEASILARYTRMRSANMV